MDEFELRLRDIALTIRRRWLLIASVTVIGALSAGTLSFMMPEIYRVETLLSPVGAQQSSIADSVLGQLGGIGGLAGALVDTSDKTEEEAIAYLQSRTLTRDFIEERNLLPQLFPDAPAEDAGDEDTPTIWDGVRKFEDDIRRVERDRVSGLIRFAIEWRDAETAEQWSLGLINEANSRLRNRAIKDAETNIEFLKRELEKTSIVGLQQSIYQLIESQINAAMLAQARSQYAFRIIDPPLVPDADDFVRPRRALIIAVGLGLGFVLSLAIALVLDRRLFAFQG